MTQPAKLNERLISLAATLTLFGLLAGGFYFWDSSFTVLSPSFTYTFIFALVILFIGWRLAGSHFFKMQRMSLGACCLGLVLLFFSDWLTRGFNLFQGPPVRGEFITVFLLVIFFLHRISKNLLLGYSIASAVVLFSIFLIQSKGFPLLSDDHASFIFRLTLLKDHFPSIPLYHPWWNAGLDARDFFATGALSFFFLTAPLHYLLSISDSYDLAVGLVLFGVLPLSLSYATSLARVPSPGPAIAALLSIASSLVWYRWSLKYGTMGFITSAALMPTAFMLACKLVHSEKLSPAQFLLLIVSFSLACMWPLGGACFLALAVIALIRSPSLFRSSQAWIALLLLVAVNLPWATLLWKVSQVGSFLSNPKQNAATFEDSSPATATFRHKQASIDLKKALKALREQANGTNPLLLFLGLPGLFLLSRRYRYALMVEMLLLLLGGTLLVTIKPQLELDRLLIFLTILLIIPCSYSLGQLFERRRGIAILPSVAFTFLFLSPFAAANVLYNRSAEIYHFGGPLSQELPQALQTNLGEGRAVFTGFVLHDLNDGHLAPLATWSEKPLVASSPFHNRWKYTNVIPAPFMDQGEPGITKFLDLQNAEVVLAHEPQWRNFFLDRPEAYELVWKMRPFLMFKRKHFVSNYFVEGSGQILAQRSDGIDLKLAQDSAVIKFNYFPFLKADGCELSPFDAGLEFPLIRLSGCPTGHQLQIRSVGPLERILQ